MGEVMLKNRDENCIREKKIAGNNVVQIKVSHDIKTQQETG